MSEYNQYVDAVNKIFEYIENLKLAIIDPDNLSAIENIESYKQIVIANANLFSQNSVSVNAQEDDEFVLDDTEGVSLDD